MPRRQALNPSFVVEAEQHSRYHVLSFVLTLPECMLESIYYQSGLMSAALTGEFSVVHYLRMALHLNDQPSSTITQFTIEVSESARRCLDR